MKHVRARPCAAFVLSFVAAHAHADSFPAHLESSLAIAYPGKSVVTWCQVPTAAGLPSGVAAAVESAPMAGHYVAIQPDGKLFQLAPYSGKPEVSCHTPASARALSRLVGGTPTVAGAVAPKGKGMVVCGFIEPTVAQCWQYSVSRRMYFSIGGWAT